MKGPTGLIDLKYYLKYKHNSSRCRSNKHKPMNAFNFKILCNYSSYYHS